MICLSLSLDVWGRSWEACGLALVPLMPQEPCWWQRVFFCTFVALSSRGTRSHMDLYIENLHPFRGMMRVFDWNRNLTAFLGFPASQETMLAWGNQGRWKPGVACDGRLFWISAFLLCFVSFILLLLHALRICSSHYLQIFFFLVGFFFFSFIFYQLVIGWHTLIKLSLRQRFTDKNNTFTSQGTKWEKNEEQY